ncbi:hypothetical protein FHX49_002695 [Microbacterium endophyticum]|uniref:Htaa domain-containing protein n=1 Tax=Microbacterium endophyticum TaxID=1526412 RepID=A0A7W4V595_9MICO|nr:HtaA domain-containing protein [Microbacterium endophyticum]MBB2977098.1 hypothetical protein [Microbacterium endophyticum]NIK36108.1 hypothetical protein [Microbacterium endophyticum]
MKSGLAASTLRLLAGGAGIVFVAAGLLSAASTASSAAEPTSATSASAATACEVTSAQLVWGFKESFRSYISGSIANGDWEVNAPVTYETPEFTWPQGSGEYDPERAIGTISFEGGVTFSGHDGLLNTSIGNPTLVFDEGGAHLLLDVSGVSMSDAMAGNAENVQTATQVRFADLDLAVSPLDAGDGAVTATAIPAAITAEGFAAFGNYEAGTALDPMSVAMTLDCAAPELEAGSEPEAASTSAASVPRKVAAETESASGSLFAWVGVGGAAVLIAAVASFIVVRRRSKERQ